MAASQTVEQTSQTKKKELSSLKKELFKYTLEGKYDEVKQILSLNEVPVDSYDQDGHTALHHAAYKGDYKLCKLFLDCGADINLTTHLSRYSALTFASLSGKADVVNLLLEKGASVSSLNSINKTAAQMASFVGNHHIVVILNNFIPIDEIDYFTYPQGLEKEPKLPPFLRNPVHKMAIMPNLNPVRIVMYIQANPCILENSKNVVTVLTILSEKMYKDKCNELLSLKYHHVAQVLKACENFLKEIKNKSDDAVNKFGKEVLNPLIKHWLNVDENGFPIAVEKFLRKEIREYPFVESIVFQQFVRTLAQSKIGEEPSAISIINEAATGPNGFDNITCCATCCDLNAEKKCSACKSVIYCDKTCQKLHWFTHKNMCPILKKAAEEKLAEKLNDANAEGTENQKSDSVEKSNSET